MQQAMEEKLLGINGNAPFIYLVGIAIACLIMYDGSDDSDYVLSSPLNLCLAERIIIWISSFNGAKSKEGFQCFETIRRVSNRSG